VPQGLDSVGALAAPGGMPLTLFSKWGEPVQKMIAALKLAASNNNII
jgi:hypothetical protein